MTILRILNRGIGHDLYDVVDRRVDIAHQHPPGLIMHGVSEVNGTMQVAQVWESVEYAQRFDDEVLIPALQAVGAPLAAEVTVFELEHLVTP